MAAHGAAETVSFSTRGQLVVPTRLRRKFGIQQGTRAVIYEEGDHIVIKPITKAYLDSLRGSLKGASALKSLMDDRRREREL